MVPKKTIKMIPKKQELLQKSFEKPENSVNDVTVEDYMVIFDANYGRQNKKLIQESRDMNY